MALFLGLMKIAEAGGLLRILSRQIRLLMVRISGGAAGSSGHGRFPALAPAPSSPRSSTIPAIGPDRYTGYLVSTLQGSTETTFYVIAVYFGALQIRRVRHTLAAALTADVAGEIFAIVGCSLFLSVK